MREGAAAADAVAEASRWTSSRRDLARHPHFEEVSPAVGELDEEAFGRLMDDDPDAALALLADVSSATDARLRELARRLAARIMVDVARRGRARRRGIGRIETRPFQADGGDLDLDASLEAITDARSGHRPPDQDRLRVRGWRKRGTALCLIVDRSGSMGGAPLAAAALAAAAVAGRAPEDYSVLAFGRDVVVAKSQDVARPPDLVIGDLLALRGFGTTDLAGALRVAAEQLGRSSATRRIAVLLSDCRPTVPGDVVAAARAFEALCVLAPGTDDVQALELAALSGGKVATIRGPSDIPDALTEVLEE